MGGVGRVFCMKTKVFLSAFIILSHLLVLAKKGDMRDSAVLDSKMVKAILKGLNQEQGLKCQMTRDETGDLQIQYLTEDNLNKFNAAFLCNDGRSVIIKGVIGDGGKTATESFKLVYAN